MRLRSRPGSTEREQPGQREGRHAVPIFHKAHADHENRPLHGVPILLKNNIGTLDKMQTSGM